MLLATCLLALAQGCQSDTVVPAAGDPSVVEADPDSGDVIAEAQVAFTDEPSYDAEQTKVSFKVEAANDSAVSYAYYFAHGQNLSCDNFTTTGSGAFGVVVVVIDDNNDYGDRLICIRGIDAQGKMSSVIVSRSFKREAPQTASDNVDVAVSIDPDGIMKVSKAQGSVASSFKYCVLNAQDTQGNPNECPTADETTDKFNDAGDCSFTAGTLGTGVDIASGKQGDLIVCVVGINGDKQSMKVKQFSKGTALAPEPASKAPPVTLPPNNGKLTVLSDSNWSYYALGKHSCSSQPFFKNTGTDAITVKFSYRNDTGINKTRREQMFSDIVYQVYHPDNHEQVRSALINSYCRNGQVGAGTVIKNSETLNLPAGHQVITIFKAKDPYSMHHDPRYFNPKGNACIEMRLTDLNNDKVIDRYRCARRHELVLRKAGSGQDLVRNAGGEFELELRLKSAHRKLDIVNATMEKAIAAGARKEWTEQSHGETFIWKIVGEQGKPVPEWLYYVNDNFTKRDGTKVTGNNQIQIGLRMSQIEAGNAAAPEVGQTYRFLMLSNSLSDKPCSMQATGSYYIYETKQKSAKGESREDKETVKFKFCPREDVLNIKIVK